MVSVFESKPAILTNGERLSEKIGILGGTFNPIHNGHLAAAREIRDRLELDRVIFVPSYLPPHKQEDDAPTAAQRLEMVRLATAGISRFEVSDIEIERGGRSYTIDTIEAFRRTYTAADLHFIIGLDSFLEIQTWHLWEKLLSLCRFIVLSRPGYRFEDLVQVDFMKSAVQALTGLDRGELAQAVVRSDRFLVYLERITLHDVSSTDIRSRVKAGESIKYLLPEVVENYIMKNRLYA